MSTARLILQYVQALVWPIVFLAAVLYLRRPIKDLLDRVGREAGEISAGGFGFQVVAKFQERLADLASAPGADANPEFVESVKEAAADLSIDQFRAIASNFYGTSIGVRQEAARAISQIAANLALDDVLRFTDSPNNGERVGAAIALGVQLTRSPEARTDPRVASALSTLLRDANSRVRYRAAEAIEAYGTAPSALLEQLKRMAEQDSNGDVRKRASTTVRRSGGHAA